MEKLLREKLWEYIKGNNPDLLIQLQEDQSVGDYLDKQIAGIRPMLSRLQSEKAPSYIIEEIGMNMLTRDLRPSRFNYIEELLHEEFISYYLKMLKSGMLTYEIINLIKECKTEFDSFECSEDAADKIKLRYFTIGTIAQYIESQ